MLRTEEVRESSLSTSDPYPPVQVTERTCFEWIISDVPSMNLLTNSVDAAVSKTEILYSLVTKQRHPFGSQSIIILFTLLWSHILPLFLECRGPIISSSLKCCAMYFFITLTPYNLSLPLFIIIEPSLRPIDLSIRAMETISLIRRLHDLLISA